MGVATPHRTEPHHCTIRSGYKKEPWLEAKLERTPVNQNRRPSPGLPGLDCSSLWAEFTDISRAEALPVEGWEPLLLSTARLSWNISLLRSSVGWQRFQRSESE